MRNLTLTDLGLRSTEESAVPVFQVSVGLTSLYGKFCNNEVQIAAPVGAVVTVGLGGSEVLVEPVPVVIMVVGMESGGTV